VTRALAAAACLLCLAAPGRADAAACCLSSSVVGVGRLIVWEDGAGGLGASWARGVGRFDADGKWRGAPAGTTEDELRAELWAIVRLWEPLQLSARVPWVFGVRTSGEQTSFGTGIGDVSAALRWEAIGLGAWEGVPGLSFTAGVVAPTGRRPEAATDALGASATGRGAVTFGLGATAEYTFMPWFVRLDVGGTASAPFRRADTGALQTLGPAVQVAVSGGRELLADRLVLAAALKLDHETPHYLDGEVVPGSQSTGLSASLSASLTLTPHWQLVGSVSSDVLGRLGIGHNRDERFGASLGVRYGYF
jgi:hypothetical protein